MSSARGRTRAHEAEEAFPLLSFFVAAAVAVEAVTQAGRVLSRAATAVALAAAASAASAVEVLTLSGCASSGAT